MSVRRDGYAPELLSEVAELCGRVHGLEPKPAAVANRFGIAPTTAHKLIRAARQAGHPIVKDYARKYPPPRVRCDCGVWSTPAEGGFDALLRHTLSVHGRYPSTIERTPRTGQVAA
jgi:hypothetical protein